MKNKMRFLTLVVPTVGALIVASGCSSEDTGDPSSDGISSSTQPLFGCDLNDPCSTPLAYCYYLPNDLTSGKFECITANPANKHWDTKCAAGYYCDALKFNPGCVSGTSYYHCNMNSHALELSSCGDGYIDPGESCDDGNVVNCDGCRADCSAVETGCGDGFKCGTEECDLGTGNVNGGACEANCTLPVCGNGITDATESCDDGNQVNGDGCDNNCTPTACGNNVVSGSEACDDGNNVNGDGCDNNCTPTGCGNGIMTGTEQCDDGNKVNSDGCEADCTLPFCGNGIVDSGEQCDDGNQSNGDLCSTTCVTQTCAVQNPVPCVVNEYGCYGTVFPNNTYCNDGSQTLGCQCPNPNDGNRGTWLPLGTNCNTASLCWALGSADGGTGGAGGSGGSAGTGGTSGSGGSAGADAGLPWSFTITSSQPISGTAEVRTKPQWAQLATFTASPANFTTPTFDPSTQKLTVQWPVGAPADWLCEVSTLLGSVAATDPLGNPWHGVAVSNGLGGCDVGLVAGP